MSYQGYILYTEDKGIFIGDFLGLGFWSNWDPGDQDHAVVFESKEIAEQVISSWLAHPGNYRLVAIKHEKPHYASREEISAAGLPIWSLDSVDSSEGRICEPIYDSGLVDLSKLNN